MGVSLHSADCRVVGVSCCLFEFKLQYSCIACLILIDLIRCLYVTGNARKNARQLVQVMYILVTEIGNYLYLVPCLVCVKLKSQHKWCQVQVS